MYLKVYCCAIFMSDLDSWDSVDAKNGLTHLDWIPDTRNTKCVLKWVIVHIAAFCCANWLQIWIPETENYQKVSSYAIKNQQKARKAFGASSWRSNMISSDLISDHCSAPVCCELERVVQLQITWYCGRVISSIIPWMCTLAQLAIMILYHE